MMVQMTTVLPFNFSSALWNLAKHCHSTYIMVLQKAREMLRMPFGLCVQRHILSRNHQLKSLPRSVKGTMVKGLESALIHQTFIYLDSRASEDHRFSPNSQATRQALVLHPVYHLNQVQVQCLAARQPNHRIRLLNQVLGQAVNLPVHPLFTHLSNHLHHLNLQYPHDQVQVHLHQILQLRQEVRLLIPPVGLLLSQVCHRAHLAIHLVNHLVNLHPSRHSSHPNRINHLPSHLFLRLHRLEPLLSRPQRTLLYQLKIRFHCRHGIPCPFLHWTHSRCLHLTLLHQPKIRFHCRRGIPCLSLHQTHSRPLHLTLLHPLKIH